MDAATRRDATRRPFFRPSVDLRRYICDSTRILQIDARVRLSFVRRISWWSRRFCQLFEILAESARRSTTTTTSRSAVVLPSNDYLLPSITADIIGYYRVTVLRIRIASTLEADRFWPMTRRHGGTALDVVFLVPIVSPLSLLCVHYL